MRSVYFLINQKFKKLLKTLQKRTGSTTENKYARRKDLHARKRKKSYKALKKKVTIRTKIKKISTKTVSI